MTNYYVYEPNSVDEELQTNQNIKVNDTIEYISNNQEGYEKYKVVLIDGKKDLELIDSFDDMDYDYTGGARRKTARRKTARRKTTRRKTARRKTARRKTARRKTARRKSVRKVKK